MTRRRSKTAVEDTELWEAVRTIAREEAHELAADGRVKVEENASAEEIEGWIQIQPSRPEAAPLSLDVWGDTVGFGPGRNGAHFEIWSRANPDWDSELRELIRCVKAGRYSERVKRGWIFALKVEMRFDGIQDGKGRTYTPSYASLPEPEDEVTVGEYRYEAW
jgi:hypothetical protein